MYTSVAQLERIIVFRLTSLLSDAQLPTDSLLLILTVIYLSFFFHLGVARLLQRVGY